MTAAPKRRGRPPSLDPRSVRLEVRMTPEEMATLAVAAIASEATLSAYCRATLLRAAKRVKP